MLFLNLLKLFLITNKPFSLLIVVYSLQLKLDIIHKEIMIELHRSEYVMVSFDEATKFCYYIYYASSQNMTDEEYMEEIRVFADIITKYQPKHILGNMIDFQFIITPDIQDWINETLFSL